MNGILTVNQKFIESVSTRISEALKDGEMFEKEKKKINLPSNESLIEKLSNYQNPKLINDLIEICFIASLEKEEGRFYNFSVALTPPELINDAKFQFQIPIEFNPTTLTKLAPAINPNYFCIGVWFNEKGDLEIWGFSEVTYPRLTLSTSTSGKIILNCAIGVEKSFKCFISMAETGFISLQSVFHNPVAKWLEPSSFDDANFFEFNKGSDFANIVLNMFSHGNGGTILLVPQKEGNWVNSIQQPILYSCSDAYLDKRISEKYLNQKAYLEETYGNFDETTINRMTENIAKRLSKNAPPLSDKEEKINHKFAVNEQNAKNALLDIGNLTKIDGATVLSKNIEVLAFGARIKPVNANNKPDKIIEVTPFEECKPKPISLPQIGGTRHQSAAQFVFDQNDCISVVASHDGRLSVFWWMAEYEIMVLMKHFEAMIG